MTTIDVEDIMQQFSELLIGRGLPDAESCVIEKKVMNILLEHSDEVFSMPASSLQAWAETVKKNLSDFVPTFKPPFEHPKFYPNGVMIQ